jgi:succinate dehydrogenase / fumarate reductase membrane anchor subunit
MKTVRARPSAHAGFSEWLLQRATAVYLAGFCAYLLVRFLLWPIDTHAAWRAWFGQGGVRLAWALAIASLLIHAWIGMRSVYLDYVKPLWVRLAVQFATAVALAAATLWAVQVLMVEAAR